MQTLHLCFTQAADGIKNQTFTQLKRKGNVAIYERRRSDGSLFGYEVFIVKCKVFPGQTVPKEVYPKANSFGKTAWFCANIERAEYRFKEACL